MYIHIYIAALYSPLNNALLAPCAEGALGGILPTAPQKRSFAGAPRDRPRGSGNIIRGFRVL